MNFPDRTQIPPTFPMPEMTCPDDSVEKLPNGITFHSFSGGDQPVCCLSVIFQGGLEAGSDILPKLTLAQLSEGTDLHSADEISEMLDFYGVRVSQRFFDHHSVLDYFLLNDTAEKVLPLIIEILTRPTFPADRLETERLRLLTAYRTTRTQMPSLAAEEMQRLLFGPEHLCGHVSDENTISSITAEDCRMCHQRLLQPATMNVFLSGFLTPGLKETVKEAFSEIRGSGKGYSVRIEKPDTVEVPCVRRLEHPDTFQAAVMVAIPTVLRSNPDYNDIRLAVQALGGYFGSRLMRNIREDKGLTYGISASLNGSLDFSYVNITATCDRSFTDRVLAEIDAEIRGLASNPPEGDELRRLVLFSQSSLASILDTPWSIMRYHQQPMLISTPEKYFEAQQQAILNLTSGRIAEIASKYLLPQKSVTVIA